jgi:hypothetical protein
MRYIRQQKRLVNTMFQGDGEKTWASVTKIGERCKVGQKLTER